MVAITLPDRSIKDYPQPITGRQVAESIGTRLARDAIAVRITGELKDLDTLITTDATVQIITRTHQDALEILRHDAAHILAEAVKELYPETLLTIGPAIENGFYYDFYREKSFTPEDLILIEERMREIVKRDEKICRKEWSRNQAIAFFKDRNEPFKAEILEALPESEIISVYTQGSFTDPCLGPHSPSTGYLGQGFKLMKVAGAYWRGDSKNPMLQRIYGTAWADEKQLQTYLTQLEEAEKRNHKKLGREMDLFHFQEAAAGSVFWHPRGWQLYRLIETYIRERLQQHGYVEVRT
ncbi:MAG: TGS domain-containing protein, partial [Alphaproteobacteria bacterium]|nr:TGS domain-containing protein [Alphaproteobacteria bacterium]